MENLALTFQLINQNAENLRKWLSGDITTEVFQAERNRIEALLPLDF